MKILIAEDDPASRRLLETILRNAGHEVLGFPDGQAAWEHYQIDPVSYVISDWMMPVMDGIELCRRIRAHSTHAYTYFIVVTAKSGRENYHAAMEQGVDDFLAKPLDATELFLRLRVAERIISFESQLRELKAMMPICMMCKKIRDDAGYWQQVEQYLHEHEGMDFTHGICPTCYERMLHEDAALAAAAAQNPPPA